jgi:hypothetical protein
VEFDRDQQIVKCIMALQFCKWGEHPAAQNHFSWHHYSPDNQPLCRASHQNITTVDKSKKTVETTTINRWHQELTPTNITGMSHTTWPNPYKSPE